MIHYTQNRLAICFFDKEAASARDILHNSPQIALAKQILASKIFIPNQVHGTKGIIVTNDLSFQPMDADYLITNTPEISLAIYTADCLPIVFYDTKKQAIGLAHAGWPGTVQNIAIHCINDMQKTFHSDPNDIEIFFGPSCKPCCYEVGPEFIDKLALLGYQDADISKILYNYDNKLLLDLPGLNCLQLERAGIALKSIHTQYNICTICSTNYCSYRRDKDVKRQITAIALNMT